MIVTGIFAAIEMFGWMGIALFRGGQRNQMRPIYCRRSFHQIRVSIALPTKVDSSSKRLQQSLCAPQHWAVTENVKLKHSIGL